jgi:ABC-type phosphate transport system permease subunit
MSTSPRPRRTVTRIPSLALPPSQLGIPDAALLALARILGEIAAQASNRSITSAVDVSERSVHAN